MKSFVESDRRHSIDREVIVHHLHLMGWPAVATMGDSNGLPLILDRPGFEDVTMARNALTSRRAVVALSPNAGFCEAFHVAIQDSSWVAPTSVSEALNKPKKTRDRKLRTLHAMKNFWSRRGYAVLTEVGGKAVWWWLPEGAGILFIGTKLAADLVRYRQGDPRRAGMDPKGAMWGYEGERPNYLFDEQRSGEPAAARHADEWAWFLANFLAGMTGVNLNHVLPDGAPGAVVLTGDDDQAALDCYRAQLDLLGDAPITYFLHPLTKHSRQSLQTMLSRPGIELGLHPDALDAPHDYDARFSAQAKWFKTLVGRMPRSVRNHGFLNCGYWGHLSAWLAAGIEISTNLPGVDGTVLNGSLLPARVVRDDQLTNHWSLLTAVGDGVLFTNTWSDAEVPDRIAALGERIRSDGIPGILVFNLHPENIARTRVMHESVLRLTEDGFLPWGLEQCLDWFRSRDPSVL